MPEITEDEKPFDIPKNWKWVRVGQVMSVFGGKRIPAGRHLVDKNTGHKYIRVTDMKAGSISNAQIKYVPDDIYDKIKAYTISKNDVYITVAGTIGQLGLVPEEFDNANLTENADKLCVYGNCKEFVYYIMSSSLVQNQIHEAVTKVGQPKLAITRIQTLILPLPPLSEQKRIVAKIEKLLPYIDRYEKAWSKLENLNKRFPMDLQKSIIQTAIQGKLVEQRPEEGTADELYQQIQAEKQRLIKEGTIKKEKPLPEITEDEKPFDIPESWKWVRLDDIVQRNIKRGKSPKYAVKSNTLVFAQKCNSKTGGINLSLAQYLDESFLSKYPKTEFLHHMDIVVNSTGNGTLGRVGIFMDMDNEARQRIVPDSHVTVIRVIVPLDAKYIYYYLKSNQRYFESMGDGSTNQTELKPLILRMLLIPLPPLAEQKRIVAKLEEILPLCEKLKSN